MTSYIRYDILKSSVLWKIWRRRAPNFICGEWALGWSGSR